MVEALISTLMTPPFIFLGVVLVAVFVLKELFGKPKGRGKGRSSKYKPNTNWAKNRNGPDKRINDAADQLKLVMGADFKPRPLLNKPEAKVFKSLDAAVIERNPAWQVMAQVSLGEFLSSPDRSAFFSVNSKRVDFALMDEKCCVVHALEYQGTGHHQGSAAARDAVKKEALRKAGIGYHEIVAGHTTPAELRQLVEKLVPGV
ncbi:DUF2726 domain-containing protein [Aurantiacibacter marinus]|nr:DUF2726 domain-containing protein [Aurantiacibacter marinus]